MTYRGRWPGTWAAICDVCGFRFPSDKLKLRWDNLTVCHDDWEVRHPQDFLKIPKDKIAPDWVKPENLTFRESIGVFEILTATDTISVTQVIPVTDNIYTSDVIYPTLSSNPYLNDTGTTSESLTSSFSTNIYDSSTTTETIGWRTYDTTQLNGFVLNGLGLNSSDLLTVSVSVTDTATTSDSITKQFGVNTNDTVNHTDNGVVLNVTTNLTDSATSAEYLVLQATSTALLGGRQLNGASLNAN